MMFLNTAARRVGGAAAALVLFPFVLAAQGGGNGGTLTGRVTSAGDPLAGATIVAAGRAAQTRADGRYRLTVPAGRVEVLVRAICYTTARDTVSIATGVTTTRDFSLARAVATL